MLFVDCSAEPLHNGLALGVEHNRGAAECPEDAIDFCCSSNNNNKMFKRKLMLQQSNTSNKPLENVFSPWRNLGKCPSPIFMPTNGVQNFERLSTEKQNQDDKKREDKNIVAALRLQFTFPDSRLQDRWDCNP